MKILAIETTGHFASVALGNRQITNDTDYSHLEQIVPMCMEILASENMNGEDLDAIAVSKGPGSFTGIRIGLASAKGLAQIWHKPIVAVPTLDSFAYRNFSETDQLIVPVFDARREQVYAAAFRGKKVLIPAAAYDIAAFKKMLDNCIAEITKGNASLPIYCFGDGTKLIGKESSGAQDAKQVLALAEKMFSDGDITDCYLAAPDYMRLAEAERKLKEKDNER